jgi:glutathione S-transferase
MRRLGLPATTTPVLIRGDGDVVQGSGRILDWALGHSADPALEERFSHRIGPLVRRFIYSATLRNPASRVRNALMDDLPPLQAMMGRIMWPATRRLIESGFKTSPAYVPRLAEEVESELAWFEGVLHERGAYLHGGAFSRMDITAASLLGPLAGPDTGPIAEVYRTVCYPAEVEETLKRWWRTPALMWVKRIYGAHRTPSAA